MVELRLAKVSDISALESLMQRSVSELGPRFYTEQQTRAAAQFLTVPDPDIIRDRTYFIALSEGAIVGCGGWSRRRKLFTGNLDQEDLSSEWLEPATDRAKIRAMFVEPGFARQGIGERIYLACEQSALEFGFTGLELMSTLPGVPFYRRMGFVEEGPENIHLPDGSLLPCVRMYKILRRVIG
jgi:GNAT superfamily N-acetyltransferase